MNFVLGQEIEFGVSSSYLQKRTPLAVDDLYPALYVLNIIDCLFSVYYLHFWKIEEDNPLLQWAFQISPALFVLVKMGLVVFSIEVLRRTLREGTFKTTTLSLLTLVYLSVSLWHLFGLYLVIFEVGS